MDKKRASTVPMSVSSFFFEIICGRIVNGHLSLDGQSSNTGKVLALQKLQRGSATSGNVGDLVLLAPLGNSGGSITTSNNRDSTLLTRIRPDKKKDKEAGVRD